MNSVCAYQFDVEPKPGETSWECFAAIRDELANWMRASFKGKEHPEFAFAGRSESFGNGQQIVTTQQTCSTHGLAMMVSEFPVPPLSLCWRTTYRVACNSRSVQFACNTEMVPTPFAFRPATFRSGVSSLLKILFERWQCSIAGEPVPTSLKRLREREVDKFVQKTLLSPKRVLPVVVMAWDAFPPIDADTMTRIWKRLLGFSHAVVLSEQAAASMLTRHLGPELTCTNGVRVYWPGLSPWSAPGEHTYRAFDQIRVAGLDNDLYDVMARVSADRFQEGHIIHEARTALVAAPAEPAQTIAPHIQTGADTQSLRKLHDELGKLRGECYHLECQNTDLKKETASLKEGNAAAQERVRDLEDQLAKARDAAKRAQQEVGRANDLHEEVKELRAHRENFRKERDLAQRGVQVLQEQLAQAHAKLMALGKADHTADHDKQTWEELCAELERAWDENKHLQAQVESARQQIADLEAKLENYEQHYWMPSEEAESGRETATDMDVGEPTFASITDALLAASAEFDDVLTVWDDAWESAKESLYASPESAYRALQAIAEVGRDYFSAQAGARSLGPIGLAFRGRVPFKYASFESQTTLAWYGDERIFHHHGDSRQMQRHLTLGGGQRNNCLQIYFEFDDATQRVLIGYCGRHLRYARNRT